jgi:hypothetical protein
MTTYEEYCDLCNELLALVYQKSPTIEMPEMINYVDMYNISMIWKNSVYTMINNVFYNYTLGHVTPEYFDKFLGELKDKLVDNKSIDT